MVPSALRTLSVVTLLSAVSGTVFLLNDHSAAGAAAGAIKNSAGRIAGTGGGPNLKASAALDASLMPAPRVEAAEYKAQLRSEADAREARAEEAAAAAKAKARAKAKAVAQAKAAVERRRLEARERASRSARRDPRALARIMAADRGWGASQFSCLSSLWQKESGWNYQASNPSSGVYGIPQALPGSKMASAGADWRTNPATQIRWGLGYIADRYGTPCGAWGHSQSSGWY